LVEFTKRRKVKDDDEQEQRRLAALQTREVHGIETLEDDEELIDDDTFDAINDRLNDARVSAAGGVPGQADPEQIISAEPIPEPAAPAAPPAAPPAATPAAPEEILLDVVAELPSERASDEELAAASSEEAPDTPAAVVALEAEIDAAKNRDEIARLSLRLARRYAANVALFVLSRGTLAGLEAQGPGFTDRIDGIMLPAEGDALLQQVAATGRPVRGKPPQQGLDVRILRAMGRDGAHELALIPISIRGRVVNVLYADNGDATVGITQLAALRALALGVASSYERIILQRKTSGS